MPDAQKVIKTFSGLVGKLGILGGSFDPVHNAHLAMAQAAYKSFDLDCVVFIPTYRNPLKAEPFSTTEQRLEMLQLALKDKPNCIISSFEIDNKSLYSIDTVLSIKEQAPEVSEIFLMHGSDCIENLHKWHKIEELLDLVNFIIIDRAGQLPASPLQALGISRRHLNKLVEYQLPADLPEISASAIRDKISRGTIPTDLLPAGLGSYIESNGLYGYSRN